MRRATWVRVFDLFRRSVELAPAERARFLEGECLGDVELRGAVERLLTEDGLAGPLDSGPGLPVSELWRAAPGLAPGGRVGPFRIVRVLAAGGMGTVYEAEQEHPRRSVALKTIRPGSFSDSALRRFQLEAEILGTLEHPGIARIFASGVHGGDEAPVPYMAMEYVRESRDLLRHAQHEGLSTRARIELLLRVCDAVHHAHQRGVIHRDLKPSNVLVDERGDPKVIDFGIARVTEPGLVAVSSPHTVTGQLGGTLLYMSPEQLAGSSGASDVRSDVYALGVVTFQLLGGTHPYDLEGLGLAQAVRRLGESEPRRLGDVSPELAGDLEWIAARAMERDPERRYASVHELAADLRRHLAHEPVLAGPSSGWYRFRKLARRHRAAFAVAGTVAAVGAAGLWATLWQADRARRHAADAIEAQGAAERSRLDADGAREQAENARALAEREARLARLVNDFYSDMFHAADAYALGPEVRVVDVLEVAVGKARAVEDPLLRAILLGHVGEGFLRLRRHERAQELLADARRGMARETDPASPHRLHLEAVWADCLEMVQRLDACREVAERALPVAETALGADHVTTRYLRASLATVEQKVGDPLRAEELWRVNLRGWESETGPESEQALDLRHKVGIALNAQGRHREARDWLADTVARKEAVFGRRHLSTLASLLDLASAEWELGDLPLAEELLREVYEGQRALGAPDNNLCGSANNLAAVLTVQGKSEEALEVFAEVERLVDRLWTPPSLAHLRVHFNRAAILRELGDFAGAERESLLALETAAGVVPRDHALYAQCLGGVMQSIRPLGRGAEAEEMLLEHLHGLEDEHGPDHPSALAVLGYVVEGRHLDGRLQEAEDAASLLLERTPRGSDAWAPRAGLLERIRAERAVSETP